MSSLRLVLVLPKQEFGDMARLEMRFDLSKECVYCCEQMNGFWSGDDHRLYCAQVELEDNFEDEQVPRPVLLAHCAAQLLFGLAWNIGAKDYLDVKHRLAKGIEGWPTSFEEYGIAVQWRREGLTEDEIETETVEYSE